VGAPLTVEAGDTLPHPLQGIQIRVAAPGCTHPLSGCELQISSARSCQVAPASFGSLPTVAANCCVAPGSTVANCGETETLTGTSTVGTVIATEANFVVSDTDLAVRTTFKVTPGAPGAVYDVGTPLAVVLEETDPHRVGAPLQVMLHVTPLPEGSLLTVAVKFVVACGGTENFAGETETLTAGGGGGVLAEPQPHAPKVTSATARIPGSNPRLVIVGVPSGHLSCTEQIRLNGSSALWRGLFNSAFYCPTITCAATPA
jgi:hypothetical protein